MGLARKGVTDSGLGLDPGTRSGLNALLGDLVVQVILRTLKEFRVLFADLVDLRLTVLVQFSLFRHFFLQLSHLLLV